MSLSSQYAPPGESALDLFTERSNLDGMILAGVGYGILFTIYVQCALLILGNARAARQTPWLIYYSTAMFVLATIAFGTNTKFIEMTYIDYRNYPGGPNAFTAAFYANWVNLFSFTCYVIMSWLADGLVLYRFMLIYNYNLWMLPLPALIYTGIVTMSISLLVAMTRPGADFWSNSAVNFGIAYWSLSIALNITLTLLIAGRLFVMRARIRKVLGAQHSTPYVSVLSMMVESAALYSIWGLVFIISYARGSPFQNIVLPPLGQIQGIAPLLIIFRVGQGKAWSRDTVTATNGSTSINIKRPMTNGTTNSIPLSEMSTKVNIQVGKTTLVSHDHDHEQTTSEWELGKGSTA